MYTNTFHDPVNAHNYLLDNSYAHRYRMQPPGQKLGSVPDVNIRLTHWAGNRCDNLIDVETDLQRYPKRKLHDERSIDEIREGAPTRAPAMSAIGAQWCTHTRVTTPLWTAKDAQVQTTRQDILLRDPLAHFHDRPMRLHNEGTRLGEKDQFARRN